MLVTLTSAIASSAAAGGWGAGVAARGPTGGRRLGQEEEEEEASLSSLSQLLPAGEQQLEQGEKTESATLSHNVWGEIYTADSTTLKVHTAHVEAELVRAQLARGNVLARSGLGCAARRGGALRRA
jgi:hypothetical protein